MMNPAARQKYLGPHTAGWTRIDMLLALFDGAIGRLETAADALGRADHAAAAPHLIRGQRMVIELLAGLDLKEGQLPQRLRDLYAFVLQQTTECTADSVRLAARILQTIREGFEGIREEARRLERNGELPGLEEGTCLQTLA